MEIGCCCDIFFITMDHFMVVLCSAFDMQWFVLVVAGCWCMVAKGTDWFLLDDWLS